MDGCPARGCHQVGEIGVLVEFLNLLLQNFSRGPPDDRRCTSVELLEDGGALRQKARRTHIDPFAMAVAHEYDYSFRFCRWHLTDALHERFDARIAHHLVAELIEREGAVDQRRRN